MAQTDISTTATVNADADHVWKILGEDFLDVGRWATSISHSTPTAPTDERLVTFDRSRRTRSYSVAAKTIPPFVTGMLNEWSVEPAGNGTARVTSRITADARGAMGAIAAPMMRGLKRRS